MNLKLTFDIGGRFLNIVLFNDDQLVLANSEDNLHHAVLFLTIKAV